MIKVYAVFLCLCSTVVPCWAVQAPAANPTQAAAQLPAGGGQILEIGQLDGIDGIFIRAAGVNIFNGIGPKSEVGERRVRRARGSGRFENHLIHGRRQSVAGQIRMGHGILDELDDLQLPEPREEVVHKRGIGGEFFRSELPTIRLAT